MARSACKRVECRIGANVYGAASAPIASRRRTKWHKLFPVKSDASITATSAFDMHHNVIDKVAGLSACTYSSVPVVVRFAASVCICGS